MPELRLDEMYPTAWGIVESRRAEIEGGSYGSYDRILAQEVAKLFFPLSKVSQLMLCCSSTARKWLWEQNEPRYIVWGGEILYHKDDVAEAILYRKRMKESKKKVKKAA